MPLYEYKCQQCKRHTEKIQKFSDPEITTCPYCGGPLERVLSAPAIAFKGGGWYKDGYGNTPPPASKPAANGDSGSPTNTTATKSDSTPPPAATPAASAAASAPAAAAASTSDKK